MELMEVSHEEQYATWADCLEKVGSQEDTHAFQTLFEKFAPLIKAFAGRADAGERHPGFADEMVQETMLKIWTKAGSYDRSKSSPVTWIFTIARNTRTDLLRKHSRYQNDVSIGEHPEAEIEDIWSDDGGDDVFHHLARQRNHDFLHESLLRLPEEQRHILSKVYLEDKSHVEVARELDMPLGTVKSRLRLGLEKLKIFIDR